MARRRHNGLRTEQTAEFQCLKLLLWVVRLVCFTPIFIWFMVYFSDQSDVTCSLQSFYVPSLISSSSSQATVTDANTTTSNTTADHSIYFDLKIQNEQEDIGVYYDDLNLTFYFYHDDLSSGIDNNTHTNSAVKQLIANYTVSGFYQGSQKSTHRIDRVQTHGIPWEALANSSSNSSLFFKYYVFRVDLETTIRFKELAWKSKRHNLAVGANVQVDRVTGKNVAKEGIELKLDASETRHLRRVAISSLILLIFLLLLFCCWPWCLFLLWLGILHIAMRTRHIATQIWSNTLFLIMRQTLDPPANLLV